MIESHPTHLMHGSDWTGEDVAGWWLSEKLDGWRCVWTGTEFLSRQGDRFTVPAWFKEGMPCQVLDGELWAGPGTTHDQVNGAVRSRNWRALTYRPFDIPVPWFRIETAQEVLASLVLPPHVRPVGYRRVASTRDAIQAMRQIRAASGEGLMLRKPGSCYWPDCGSLKLLKMTPGALARLGPASSAAWRATCPTAGARQLQETPRRSARMGLERGKPGFSQVRRRDWPSRIRLEASGRARPA